MVNVTTEYGSIDVKLGILGGKIVNAMPEYDQVCAAAHDHNVPFAKVRDTALAKVNTSTLAASK
jgi:uncharacterized protein (DUF111 family)